MLRGRDLIVFSDDWGRHPFSCQHIVKRFLADNRVLWVHTVGYRSLKWSRYDVKRSWEKVTAWFRRGAPATDDPSAGDRAPEIINPLCLPFGQWRLVRRLNTLFVGRAVRSEARRLGFTDPILITTFPTTADFVDSCDAHIKVYYCVDDYTRWPGMSGRLLRELEATLLGRVDLVVATSGKLQQTRSNGRRPTRLLTHGVDVDHFGATRSSVPAPAVADIRGSVVAYFGLIDERCDLDMVSGLARRFPELTFLLIGPWRVDPAPLASHENVRIVGGVPYDELPSYLAPASVLLLPYVRDELAESLNPLKLKEYLTTGLPVVATAMPEVEKLGRYVSVVRDLDECADAIRRALETQGEMSPERQAFLRGESWDAKAEQFAQTILDVEAELP